MSQPAITISDLISLAGQTIRQPRQSLRQFLSLNLSVQDSIRGAVVILILGVLITELATFLTSLTATTETIQPTASPITFVAVQMMFFIVCSVCFYALPRMFGGQGTLQDSFAAMLWLNFVLFLLQIVFSIAMILFPFVAALLVVFILYSIFMFLVSFVQEVHGLDNTLLVFLGVIAGTLIVGLIALPLLFALGIVPTEVPNV